MKKYTSIIHKVWNFVNKLTGKVEFFEFLLVTKTKGWLKFFLARILAKL